MEETPWRWMTERLGTDLPTLQQPYSFLSALNILNLNGKLVIQTSFQVPVGKQSELCVGLNLIIRSQGYHCFFEPSSLDLKWTAALSTQHANIFNKLILNCFIGTTCFIAHGLKWWHFLQCCLEPKTTCLKMNEICLCGVKKKLS